MSLTGRHSVLLGGTGLLGGAVRRRFGGCRPAESGLSLLDSHRVFDEIAATGFSDSVRGVHDSVDVPQDWILATGIVDPKADANRLRRVNAALPTRLYQILCEDGAHRSQGPASHRFVTFGSVLENRDDIARSNPYIASKRELLQSWRSLSPQGAVPWIHVQLHTLYGGGVPHPFMFLGQMYAALKQRRPFAMSQGNQFREYHHADDIAACLSAILEDLEAGPKLEDLSSGRPVRLRDLAERIFGHFGVPDLLEVGALSAENAEVYEPCYQPSKYLVTCRDPAQGIIEWLDSLGIARARP